MLFTQTNNGVEIGNKPSLKNLFHPETIAVIGASAKPEKLGHVILKNLIESGYKGQIFPVNPKETKILDLPVTNSISSLPRGIDLALVVIPQSGVADSARWLGQIGTKNIVVISAGYKESGNLDAENELVDICKEYGMQLLGPNCLGLMNTQQGQTFNASFGFTPNISGKTTLISQSGALISSIVDRAASSEFGFNKIISLGNKAGIDEVDLLNYLIYDSQTEVIAMYLEGVSRGKELIKVLAMCQKPVVLLKAGRGQKTMEAINLHTGSLAGDDQVARSYLSKLNVILPNSLDEFFSTLFLFSKFRRIHQKSVCVITNAGGAGVLSLDYLEKTKLKIEHLNLPTQVRLRSVLPTASSVNNPIDILGDASVERYARACREVVLSEQYGAIIIILTPQVNTEIEETANMVINLANDNVGTVVIPVFIGGGKLAGAEAIFKQAELPFFYSYEQAILALDNLTKFSNGVEKDLEFTNPVEGVLSQSEKSEVISLIQTAKNNKQSALDFMAISRISQLFALPMPKFRYFAHPIDKSEMDTILALEDFSGGVAMKVVSAGELHRTDKEMVELNIKSSDQAMGFMSKFGGQEMVIQQMSPKGFEVILGIKKDPDFGRVLLVGTGGVHTEIWQDVAIAPIPISREGILDLFQKTKAWRVLNGYRGKKYDIQAMIEVTYNLTKLGLEFDEILGVDINPVIILESGVIVVDLKILI